ncbi:MAG: hypothetical protein J6S67_17570 [Methanobrevibacter sp.]|nr:hypothetical protein [Methanobrevibacter sp.]
MDGFIVVGNTNSVTYKEVFPLIKSGRLRLGYNMIKIFNTEEGTKDFGNITWFSTYPVVKKPLVLSKSYTPEEYPTYDNYPAINVDRVKDIPFDYYGTMGVPITILNYDLENVEVVGLAADKRDGYEGFVKGIPTYVDNKHKKFVGMVLNGKPTYTRILIKKNLK